MKPTLQARKALLVSILAGSAVASTGCSSSGFTVASLNPFAKASPVSQPTPEKPGITESIASTATPAIGTPAKSVSTSAKDFFGKTTGAVTSVFKRDTENIASANSVDKSDPLRLDNKPDKVDPQVFVANGQLWESTGDFGKAMESYTKALGQDDKHSPALTSMARLHFRQSNLPEAVKYFQRAIAIKTNDAGLHNDLGLTLGKMGNQSAAVASLQKALQLAPGTSRYANNLASIQFEGGDPQAAQMVLMQNNRPAVAHFNMAYLHYKKGQIGQAKTHLGQALKYEPQASGDDATGRAIQRSRDMLAQINSVNGQPATANIANAKVQTATPSVSAAQAAPVAQPSATSVAAKTPVTPSAGSNGNAMALPANPAQSTPSAVAAAQPKSNGFVLPGTTANSNTIASTAASTASDYQPPAATQPVAKVATARAGTLAPAMSAIQPSKGDVAKAEPKPVAETKTAESAPKWNSWNQSFAQKSEQTSTQVTPTWPGQKAGPQEVVPGKVAPASNIEEAEPKTGFTLPESFALPSSK